MARPAPSRIRARFTRLPALIRSASPSQGPGGSNPQTRTNYITVSAPSAPVAQFTGSPTSGVAPLTVNFTNSSTGSITSYAWTFGDGTTSTVANPSKVYSAARHLHGQPHRHRARRQQPPDAHELRDGRPRLRRSLSSPAAPRRASAPLTVNFTNSSTGSITSYAWTFGDGTTSTVANPSKVYSAPGTYTVSLTVTGPGGSNAQTRTNYITVSAPSAPVAQFTGSPTSGVGAAGG